MYVPKRFFYTTYKAKTISAREESR